MIFIFNRQNELCERAQSYNNHLLLFYQLQKLPSPCATRWFGSHCLQSGAWASPLLPTGVPSGSELVNKIVIKSGTAWADVRLSDIRLTLETFLKLSTEWPYIFKGHLNKIRKWLFIFENIIERYNTMLINYILFQMHTFGTPFF